MNKLIVLGLVFVMLIPLLVTGCGSGDKTIEITFDDFTTQDVNYQLINLDINGNLTVKLESNPSTGYSWEDPVLSAQPQVEQVSHNYVEPADTGLVGASGTDVWVFKGIAEGAGTITFIYSQPWDGGEKNVYTVYVVVTVK